MMRQLLSPPCFSDPAFARAEDAQVFARSWQLVAVAQQIPRPGDQLLVNVAGRQWVLRRGADDVVRAFHNVCLHRAARICERDGNAPLRCPYHGWTYDDRGVLIGVPFRADFGADFVPGEHRLEAAQLEAWGPALFLNPDPRAPSLQETLGPLHATLESLFAAMEHMLDVSHVDVDANWKIVMENALETYHVGFIHSKSIQPLGFEVTRTDFHGAHSVSHYSAPPSPRKAKALAFAFPDRPVSFDGYLHANIFPNSTVATAYGNFFVLTRTEPLSPGVTRLHWYMLSTKCGPRSEAAADAAKMMDDSNRQFLRATFEEDASICARTHDGCREATQPGFLGAQETRVAAFENELAQRTTSSATSDLD